MTNFDYYPRNTVTNVKGDNRNDDGSRTRWFVDGDGVLHVTHEPDSAHSDWETMTFRLVEVEQKWVEVDES